MAGYADYPFFLSQWGSSKCFSYDAINVFPTLAPTGRVSVQLHSAVQMDWHARQDQLVLVERTLQLQRSRTPSW